MNVFALPTNAMKSH